MARLGDTDLDVFLLCLGGNVFGWTLDEERSFAVLDAYFQAGGNFIDTADVYGRRGKIRHAGASNYSARRLAEALRIGEREGMAAYVALQPHYNLLERGRYEGELAAVCQSHGLACLPYFGLARGFLTGKYSRDGEQIDSPRAAGVRESYFNERGFAVLDALQEIAGAHHTAVAAVALAWLAAQPTVLAPIASATSPEQLRELLASRKLELAPAELQRLSSASV